MILFIMQYYPRAFIQMGFFLLFWGISVSGTEATSKKKSYLLLQDQCSYLSDWEYQKNVQLQEKKVETLQGGSKHSHSGIPWRESGSLRKSLSFQVLRLEEWCKNRKEEDDDERKRCFDKASVLYSKLLKAEEVHFKALYTTLSWLAQLDTSEQAIFWGLEALKWAKKWFQKEKKKEPLIQAYVELARMYVQFNQVQKAEKYIYKAIVDQVDHSEKKDDIALVPMYLILAQISQKKNGFFFALQALEEAEEMLLKHQKKNNEKEKTTLLWVHLYRLMGYIYQDIEEETAKNKKKYPLKQGNHLKENAFSSMDKALRQAQVLYKKGECSTFELSRCYKGVADLFLFYKQIDQALPYYKQALITCEQGQGKKNQQEKIVLLQHIIELYFALKQPEKAISFSDKMAKCVEAMHGKAPHCDHVQVAYQKGVIMFQEKNYKKAIQCLQQGWRTVKSLDHFREAETILLLGIKISGILLLIAEECKSKRKQASKAVLSILLDAKKIEENGLIPYQYTLYTLDIAFSLGKGYVYLKEWKNALLHLEEALKIAKKLQINVNARSTILKEMYLAAEKGKIEHQRKGYERELKSLQKMLPNYPSKD